MGDYDDGDAELFAYAPDKLQNGICGCGIESACRLVAEEHLGVCRKRAGDRYSLLLSAGELSRICLCLVAQPHGFEKLHRLFLRLGFAFALKLQREADVLQAGALHQKIEALKDHGDVPPYGAKLFVGKLAEIDSVDLHTALRWALQHVDTSHKRAFAGAAHSDYTEDIPVRDCKRNVFQRFDSSLGGIEFLRQVLDFYHM